jgi:hypothetical protein
MPVEGRVQRQAAARVVPGLQAQPVSVEHRLAGGPQAFGLGEQGDLGAGTPDGAEMQADAFGPLDETGVGAERGARRAAARAPPHSIAPLPSSTVSAVPRWPDHRRGSGSSRRQARMSSARAGGEQALEMPPGRRVLALEEQRAGQRHARLAVLGAPSGGSERRPSACEQK